MEGKIYNAIQWWLKDKQTFLKSLMDLIWYSHFNMENQVNVSLSGPLNVHPETLLTIWKLFLNLLYENIEDFTVKKCSTTWWWTFLNYTQIIFTFSTFTDRRIIRWQNAYSILCRTWFSVKLMIRIDYSEVLEVNGTVGFWGSWNNNPWGWKMDFLIWNLFSPKVMMSCPRLMLEIMGKEDMEEAPSLRPKQSATAREKVDFALNICTDVVFKAATSNHFDNQLICWSYLRHTWWWKLLSRQTKPKNIFLLALQMRVQQ